MSTGLHGPGPSVYCCAKKRPLPYTIGPLCSSDASGLWLLHPPFPGICEISMSSSQKSMFCSPEANASTIIVAEASVS